MMYFLSYDVGTTGIKTCLFQWDEGIRMVAGSSYGYGLYTLPNGGAEQDPEEWWTAMKISTRDLLDKTGIDPADISGISFCSQMQGLVLVDEDGNALRPAMSYMDQRAVEQIDKGIRTGLMIEGMNALKLLKSLSLTGAVSGSVKDPQWKYLWVKDNEPEVYSKIYKWLDVKEYLIMRMTGRAVMTRDSAFATMLYSTRDGKEGWSSELCRTFGIDEAHLPEIIESTEQVGPLREAQASELGLKPGTPVFGGGGDASLIGVGTGAAGLGKTHMYAGTSGWVGTVCDKQVVDTSAMIAAIVGASQSYYNYFAEMETAGKCLEWVKDHLALDEIGIYMEKQDVCSSGPKDREKVYSSLYDYMSEVIGSAPAGAGGVIFTPWLHGNRCPFEDPDSKGIFFGITL
ncbi:MAG: FGGY-family carbohydrate kinase, partial [Firmicutes bacterium]|nr:FGGY-family carbohydrate kinase [Bacillota bacterium]